MEEVLDDVLFWYKCAKFCFTCRFCQENYSDLLHLPSLSDLTRDLHRVMIMDFFEEFPLILFLLLWKLWIHFTERTGYLREGVHFTYIIHLNGRIGKLLIALSTNNYSTLIDSVSKHMDLCKELGTLEKDYTKLMNIHA